MKESAHLPQNAPGQVQKIDTAQIDHLLRSGKAEDCHTALEQFFSDAGFDRLDSLMMRLYITMDIYICASTFASGLGVPNEEFVTRFGSIDDVGKRLSTIRSTFDFFQEMLEQCVRWRTEQCCEMTGESVAKAKEYIRKEYPRPDLSLKIVAETVNLSPTYFSTIFKKHAGMNFIEYLTQVRLEKAKELLCCTTLPVSEIAFRVGFQDYRYFSQLFKKHTGQTPREFKNNSNQR